MKIFSATILFLVLAFTGAGAAKAAVVLDFEGIGVGYPFANSTLVQNFYNGGTSSSGTSGVNFGVTFSSNALAICLNTPGVSCSNTSRGGLGDPTSARGALFFLSGSSTFMNYSAGFTTGVSFFYAAANLPGSVDVFDGLNGTGALLGTILLPTTPGGCGTVYSAGFCPFVAAGLTFSGVGQSLRFNGAANQIVFDDVTFGSAIPGGEVPEPSTIALIGMALLSLFGIGLMRRRVEA